MPYRLDELIDLNAVQQLMENLWRLTGIPVGILDLDGKLLVAIGGQEICTEFHQRHPELTARCRQYDGSIRARLQQHSTTDEELGFIEYSCRNGLVDALIPIQIGGRQLATLFTGPYFRTPPDSEFCLFR